MRTLKQIAASRANGARSRGPITLEGKAISRLNALKHGLTASTVVLSNEKDERFQALLDFYTAKYQPADEDEFLCIEEMVVHQWRLRRLWGLETCLYENEMDAQMPELREKYARVHEGARLAHAFPALCDNSRALQTLSRQESRYYRLAERALQRLLVLKAIGPQLREPRASTPPEPAENLRDNPSDNPKHEDNLGTAPGARGPDDRHTSVQQPTDPQPQYPQNSHQRTHPYRQPETQPPAELEVREAEAPAPGRADRLSRETRPQGH